MQDREYVQAPVLLKRILERTKELNFPMASDPLVGSFLRALVASKPGGHFLELGTGTGISTAWLLDGMSADARLTSVDTDAQVQGVASVCLGQDARLQLVLQDGHTFLKQQAPASYDLVFADAMPGKYDGLEDALAVVRLGGFYVIDDMLPQPNWPEGHAAKIPLLLQALAANRAFTVSSLAWASGVVVATRNA